MTMPSRRSFISTIAAAAAVSAVPSSHAEGKATTCGLSTSDLTFVCVVKSMNPYQTLATVVFTTSDDPPVIDLNGSPIALSLTPTGRYSQQGEWMTIRLLDVDDAGNIGNELVSTTITDRTVVDLDEVGLSLNLFSLPS